MKVWVHTGQFVGSGETGSGYDEDPSQHNLYGRHKISVKTLGKNPVAIPLAFFGSTSLSKSITGGAALLRDQSGNPLGVPLQISKNWHDPGNNFYHFYTQPIFQSLDADTFELTIASSRWGETYAASHAQLSLIGYINANGGHWDESALGAFGESITYDPAVSLNRAMVDYVRPLLVEAGKANGDMSNRKWKWT